MDITQDGAGGARDRLRRREGWTSKNQREGGRGSGLRKTTTLGDKGGGKGPAHKGTITSFERKG